MTRERDAVHPRTRNDGGDNNSERRRRSGAVGAEGLLGRDAEAAEATDAGAVHDPSRPEEQGKPYEAPIDPPVVAGTDGQPEIAAGFGASADEEPFEVDDQLEPAEDELSARVREHMRADSLGSQYVDRLAIASNGSTVVVDGVVEDLETQEYILELVATVGGVSDVVDRLRFPER